jgi:hypothetical protein
MSGSGGGKDRHQQHEMSRHWIGYYPSGTAFQK